MVQLIFGLLSVLPPGVRKAVVRTAMNAIYQYYTRQVVTGRENIPDGPCLFIANHLSNADGFALYRAFAPKRVFFLAGVKLQATTMTRIGTDAVDTIPIKPNSADVEALKRAVETLREGHSVLIFPEGGRSRTGALLRAKKGAALIAKRAGVPVVPVALTGTEEFLPINDQDMGGEKPRKGVTIAVTIGRPFRVDELPPSETEGEDPRQALADAMMRRVAQLLPHRYRGVYGEAGSIVGEGTEQ